MSKTWILIISAVVLVGLVVGGVIVYGSSRKSSLISNTSGDSLLPTIKPVVVTDANYRDDSGLTFNYPHDATVTDITPNDNAYYTLLDIRKGGQSLRITIKDGDFKVPADASLVGAVNLGKFAAKQYSYKSQADSLFATVAVNQGVVYLIEGPKDGGYWEDLQNAVVASVSFGTSAPAANTNSSGSDTSTSTVDEGEEVVE